MYETVEIATYYDCKAEIFELERGQTSRNGSAIRRHGMQNG